MTYPSVLVFSNNCFSKTDSNGRTLGNFFEGWPKDKLAQFYIQNAKPDFSYCCHYFRVTDAQAIKAICGGNKGGILTESYSEKQILKHISDNNIKKKSSRNSVSMLIRDAIWNIGCWKSVEYEKWVQNINPEIVLLQAGDCAFMFKLAMSTARQFGAKFVVYNTEGYYFKRFDYFRSRGFAHLMYPIFRYNLAKTIKKAYNMADFTIFNCDALREDFSNEFHIKSDVVYTATDFCAYENRKEVRSEFVTSYAGNLGVGRPQSLVDVANVLQSINQSYYLDVYGTLPNEETKQLFRNCPGIRFHGRISYDEVKKVMQDSDLLIHVESFDSFFKEDSKYAFSTKIADCLAANTCFLMYAPSEFAATQYLVKNQTAYVANCFEDLQILLQELIDNPKLRNRYCINAMELAKKNHDKYSSVCKFQKILYDLYLER